MLTVGNVGCGVHGNTLLSQMFLCIPKTVLKLKVGFFKGYKYMVINIQVIFYSFKEIIMIML